MNIVNFPHYAAFCFALYAGYIVGNHVLMKSKSKAAAWFAGMMAFLAITVLAAIALPELINSETINWSEICC